MFDRIRNIFNSSNIDSDTLFALSWKKPDTVEVIIKQSDEGYFAKVTSLSGNVVTQAATGKELVGLVNEAIYDYLEIPPQYRPELGYFMPPAEVRESFNLGVPKEYLNTTIGLATA